MEPTLDELLAQEAAREPGLYFFAQAPSGPPGPLTDAEFQERRYQSARQQADDWQRLAQSCERERNQARDIAVALEQRLAEVERIAQAWIDNADASQSGAALYTAGQMVLASAGGDA